MNLRVRCQSDFIDCLDYIRIGEPVDAVELARMLEGYIKADWSIEYNPPIITYETSFEELMGGV